MKGNEDGEEEKEATDDGMVSSVTSEDGEDENELRVSTPMEVIVQYVILQCIRSSSP